MSVKPARRHVGDRRAPGRGDAQRARLIDAVLDLLHETSVAELSVMQIAKQAGVTRPVFYFYFESKYAVLAAAMSQVWAEFEATQRLIDEFDLTQPLRSIFRELTDDAVDVWYQHHALIAAVVEARSSDEQLAALWDELIARPEQQVCRIIQRLELAGLAEPISEDLPALVNALFGMTIWSLLNHGTTLDPPARDKLVDVISTVWLASVGGRGRLDS